MTFVSSSSVKAQNISIFDIFSLFSNSSSVADPFKTIVFSSSFDNKLHLLILDSINFTLYVFSKSLAKEKPTLPPPTIIILEYASSWSLNSSTIEPILSADETK